jgi:uncharacterized protein YndB with AHSA1/START domain
MTAQLDGTTTIRTSIDVSVTPERAFSGFTEGFDSWWPREHHLLKADLKQVAVDPEVGGRLYEESVDGDVCVWGRVLTWDPPRTFAYSWLIGTDWAPPGPDARGSRVTVSFTPADGGTRVEVVHDQLDVHGEGWQSMRDAVGGPEGWPLLMMRFSALAES